MVVAAHEHAIFFVLIFAARTIDFAIADRRTRDQRRGIAERRIASKITHDVAGAVAADLAIAKAIRRTLHRVRTIRVLKAGEGRFGIVDAGHK